MTSKKKLERIIRNIIKIANEGKTVSFYDDLGGNTLTIEIDGSHTHVGVPDGAFKTLVDSLYDCLIAERGLSWVNLDKPKQ